VGVRVGLDDALEPAHERVPRVAVVGEGALDLGQVRLLTFGAQAAEEVLLARVAPVQGADADAGALGDRGAGAASGDTGGLSMNNSSTPATPTRRRTIGDASPTRKGTSA
jgi:hypothetical protein